MRVETRSPWLRRHRSERRRQHERGNLVALRVIAERDRPRLVLTDRLQNLSKRRIDDAIDQQETAEENDKHSEVHVSLIGKVDKPEQLSAWDCLDAVLAMRERC